MTKCGTVISYKNFTFKPLMSMNTTVLLVSSAAMAMSSRTRPRPLAIQLRLDEHLRCWVAIKLDEVLSTPALMTQVEGLFRSVCILHFYIFEREFSIFEVLNVH